MVWLTSPKEKISRDGDMPAGTLHVCILLYMYVVYNRFQRNIIISAYQLTHLALVFQRAVRVEKKSYHRYR